MVTSVAALLYSTNRKFRSAKLGCFLIVALSSNVIVIDGEQPNLEPSFIHRSELLLYDPQFPRRKVVAVLLPFHHWHLISTAQLLVPRLLS